MFKRQRPSIEKATSKTSYGSGSGGEGVPAVGTEAIAQQSIDWNAKNFNYPENGFLSRIEHSLLYAMVRSPKIFPAEAIVTTVRDEMDSIDEWNQYLYARPLRGSKSGEPAVSYAQLSALLCLAGEVWTPESEVPQTVCQRIVKVVVTYADEKGLDRETETQELLRPLLEQSKRRDSQAALAMVLPMYIGWTASIITANPVPFWVMYAAANVGAVHVNNKQIDEQRNLHEMVQSTERSNNVEHTSLLEEVEDLDL